MTVLRFGIIAVLCGTMAPELGLAEVTQNSSTFATKLEAPVEKPRVSEVNFQPPRGTTAISLAPVVSNQDRSYHSDGHENHTATTSIQEIQFSIEHGLSEQIAVKAFTIYGSESSTGGGYNYTRKSSGFSILDFDLEGLVPLTNEDQRIVYGANLGVNLGPHLIPSRNVEGNRSTGGFSIQPYIGYEQSFGSQFIAGSTLYYKSRGPRNFEAHRANGDLYDYGKTSGGDETELYSFLEKQVNSTHFGGALFLRSMSDGLDTFYDGSVYYFSPQTTAGISAYGAFQTNESFILKPVLTYTTLLNRDINDLHYTGFSTVRLSFLARMLF